MIINEYSNTSILQMFEMLITLGLYFFQLPTNQEKRTFQIDYGWRWPNRTIQYAIDYASFSMCLHKLMLLVLKTYFNII